MESSSTRLGALQKKNYAYEPLPCRTIAILPLNLGHLVVVAVVLLSPSYCCRCRAVVCRRADVLAVGSAFSSLYSYCTVCKYSKIHRPIKNKETDKFRLSASLSPSAWLPSASLSLSCLSSIVAAGRIGDFSLKPNRHFHVRTESYAALLSVAIKRCFFCSVHTCRPRVICS